MDDLEEMNMRIVLDSVVRRLIRMETKLVHLAQALGAGEAVRAQPHLDIQTNRPFVQHTPTGEVE